MTSLRLSALVGRAALALCAGFCGACNQYDGDAMHDVQAPSRETFAAVSSVIEAHCGSLDCHGGPARNFRVYGVYGLRANGNFVTGSPDTTEGDIDATYTALVSLDPEALDGVYARGADPTSWVVFRKARELEKHEGGHPLPEGSAGDTCLVAWAKGEPDDDACASDSFGPEARERETW